jgi:repressor LexA
MKLLAWLVAQKVVTLGSDGMQMSSYTPRQGQFLAFIYYYTKLNGRPPAEADMQQYFQITAPAVHQMVVTLEDRGFIERTPGQSRSIRLRLGREQLPDLE